MKKIKYLGLFLLFFVSLYAYLVYRAHYPSKDMIKSILIPTTRNTYIRIYQQDCDWETYHLYYEVIEDNQIICPISSLIYVSIYGEPFDFDVNRIGDITYIAECSKRPVHINAIYNHNTKKCACMGADDIDSLYQTKPFIDMTDILRFCQQRN